MVFGAAAAAFLLSAVYRFNGALGPVTPYAGAGPGLYLHRATSQAFGRVTVLSVPTLVRSMPTLKSPSRPTGSYAPLKAP